MERARELLDVLDALYSVFLGERLADAWTTLWQPALMAWLQDESLPVELARGLSERRGKRSGRRKRGNAADRSE
jgi:hypothetical protein